MTQTIVVVTRKPVETPLCKLSDSLVLITININTVSVGRSIISIRGSTVIKTILSGITEKELEEESKSLFVTIKRAMLSSKATFQEV